MSKTKIAVSGAVAAVVVAVAVLLLVGRSPSYAVVATFPDAGQVVTGNQVRVAGATVGTVSEIELADDGQARLHLKITDDDYRPLHEGTRVILRNSSLSSIANRIMVLEPGPNNAPEIADGGTILAEDTRAATDIDQVLNAVDAQGRRSLQTLVRGGATAFSGAETATGQVLERLNPALAQTRRTIDELTADEPALRRVVTGGAAVSSTLAQNRGDLERGLQSTAVTLRALATERASLGRLITRAPTFVDRATGTLADTRVLLREARPLLREVRPVAPRLATTLRLADPLTAQSVPLLRNVRATLPSVADTLGRTPRLATQVVPATTELTAALTGLKPVFAETRRYAPDLASGFLTSFGGRTAGGYDANGHFARIAPLINSGNLPEIARPLLGGVVDVLAPLLGTGLSVPQVKQQNRCPGAASQTIPDGSNPNPEGHAGRCDVTQVPPGGRNAVAP